MAGSPPFTVPALKAAAGTLRARVIYVSAANTGAVATAATVKPIGVTQNWTKYPPGTAADSPAGTIAETGDALPYLGNGMNAMCYVASDVTGGGLVEASTAGGIAPAGSAGAGKWTLGIVQDSAAAGTYVLVNININANQA